MIDLRLPSRISQPRLQARTLYGKEFSLDRNARQTRPRPVPAPLDQPGPHRIGFNVSQDLIQINLVLDRKTFEPALIDMTATEFPPVAMKQAHVTITNPVNPAAEFVHVVDLHHQVPVVAHQAIAPEADLEPLLRPSEQIQKLRIIVRAMKKGLPMIAAIEDVKTASLQMSATQAGHDFF